MKKLLKLAASLILNKADKKRWFLEIGIYLMQKGITHQIGEIVHIQPIGIRGKHQTTEVTNVYYDLKANKIKYTYCKKIEQLNEKKR